MVASLLLVLVRLLQGVSAGGQVSHCVCCRCRGRQYSTGCWPCHSARHSCSLTSQLAGAMVMTIEHAPPQGKGFVSAVSMARCVVLVLLKQLAVVLPCLPDAVASHCIATCSANLGTCLGMITSAILRSVMSKPALVSKHKHKHARTHFASHAAAPPHATLCRAPPSDVIRLANSLPMRHCSRWHRPRRQA